MTSNMKGSFHYQCSNAAYLFAPTMSHIDLCKHKAYNHDKIAFEYIPGILEDLNTHPKPGGLYVAFDCSLHLQKWYKTI